MTFARDARPVVGFSFLKTSTIPITVELGWKMPNTAKKKSEVIVINASKQLEWWCQNQMDGWRSSMSKCFLNLLQYTSSSFPFIFIVPLYFSQVFFLSWCFLWRCSPGKLLFPAMAAGPSPLFGIFPKSQLCDCDLFLGKFQLYCFL